MNGKETAMKERAFPEDVYDRYCCQIDKEDNLIDQRLNWMLASQSLLFGALGVSDSQVAKLMYLIIPIVGMGVSILVGLSVQGAVSSLRHYRDGLEEVCPPESDGEKHFPQIHRDLKNLQRGLVSPKALPWLFFGAWVLTLVWVLTRLR